MGRDHCRSRQKNRPEQERGAVLVEAALCFLFLFVLLDGVVEYGSYFTTALDAASAVRSGTRVGSMTMSDGPSSDWQIIQAAMAQAGTRRNNITRVVVYRASSAPGKPDPMCTSTSSGPAPSSLKCNVYQAQDLGKTEAEFSALPAGQNWPVAQRAPGVDYIGLWMQGRRTPLMTLIPSPTGFSDAYTMRIEPSTGTFSSVDWGTGNQTNPNTEGLWWCWAGSCPTWYCPPGDTCSASGGDGRPIGGGGSGGSA